MSLFSKSAAVAVGLLSFLPATVPTFSSQDPAMRGFADIHNHQFANLAFGGSIVVGHAYGPAEVALSTSADEAHHGTMHGLGDFLGAPVGQREPNQWPRYSNAGYPAFDGWPSFLEWNHQKMYEAWLHRAVTGGLRLIVMMAVNSPLLCNMLHSDGRCRDEFGILNRQLDAAYRMQDQIDVQSGGPGRGWYRIVTTPAEARQVIGQGKLAVVLGLETAEPFGMGAWRESLARYWARGVRHFYPVHQLNNSFGGAAYFTPLIQDLSRMETKACPHYDIQKCGTRGLTGAGRELLDELMRLGAIIDVDHMSEVTWSETITVMKGNRGYPVVASHAGFSEINKGDQDHEGQLSAHELKLIQSLGGMVGLIVGQGNLWEVNTYRRPGRHTIEHICGRSTETIAQAVYYALDKAPGMSVAVGTDFGAPTAIPGPRFGPQQCFAWPVGGIPRSLNRDWTKPKWERELRYPFPARATRDGTQLDRYAFGSRTFDFNVDGLAHVGLLPDLFADLEALEIPASALEPIYTSAEGYVRMWERAERLRKQTARHLKLTVPQTMYAGQRYPVSITMQNTSLVTWAPSTKHALGSQYPTDTQKWGVNRISLPGPVQPGAEVTFHFEVTAPADTGRHYFQWQMVQDGVEWFGQPTSAIGITVVRTECEELRVRIREVEAEIRHVQTQIKAASPGEKAELAAQLANLEKELASLQQRAKEEC